ncbi:MAG: hypothetical protein HYR73_00745 [Candidatus Eisenbacteria bacterium]|nr:hypothetical protein [Candidatus Eisenbacteria bacterium]
MIREKEAGLVSGGRMIVVLFVALAAVVWGFIHGVQSGSVALVLGSTLGFLLVAHHEAPP